MVLGENEVAEKGAEDGKGEVAGSSVSKALRRICQRNFLCIYIYIRILKEIKYICIYMY